MKILIAAWHLKEWNVGLGRYCHNILDAIGRVDHENEYEVVVPHQSYSLPGRPNVVYRTMQIPVFGRRFWEQVAPLLAGPHDLLHFPYDSSVMWKRAKFVVTIHDVKPLLFPDLVKGWNVNRWIHRMVVPDSVKQADHILTVSQSSKRDLMELLDIPGERISVVYNGVEVQRFRPPGPRLEEKKKGRPYVLSVGGGDPTKNLESLIAAFAKLPPSLRAHYDLVLAGDLRRRNDLRELVAQQGLSEQTIFTGMVSDDRLIELYQGGSVFVFPSRYEGFGLPVLEAMACGCPTISSNTSSLPEVVGDAGILLSPTDVQSLAGAIEQVLTDAKVCEKLRALGLQRAQQFSWDRTATELIAVYRKTLECAA